MGANFFEAFPAIPIGASGPQVRIDLATLVPPAGLDEHLTFICKGDFINGYISIEGSPDGVNWDVMGQFTSGQDADGQPGPALEFSPFTENAVVRYLRTNVQCQVRGTTAITVAGEQNCDCEGGGIPGALCTDITLDEDGERSSTGGAEQIVAEWYVDMAPLTAIGGVIGALFSGILRLAAPGSPGDNLARLYLGASAPGVIDGVLAGTLAPTLAVDTPLSAENNVANPVGPVLVQVTLQSDVPNGGGNSIFIRGFVAQFTCPVIGR